MEDGAQKTDMFEILTLLGIVIIAVTAMKRREIDRAQPSKEGFSLGKTIARAVTRSPVNLTQSERSGSSQSVPRDARFSFVSAFGVRPQHLRELHIYAVAGSFDQFPQKIRDLLQKLYTNGYAVGEGIMGLLHHGRPLKEGEAIYVAVARDDLRKEATRTVAFLDRYRTC
jgi:hypothetical protein